MQATQFQIAKSARLNTYRPTPKQMEQGNVVAFSNSTALGQRLAGSGALVFEGELVSPFSDWKPARK